MTVEESLMVRLVFVYFTLNCLRKESVYATKRDTSTERGALANKLLLNWKTNVSA